MKSGLGGGERVVVGDGGGRGFTEERNEYTQDNLFTRQMNRSPFTYLFHIIHIGWNIELLVECLLVYTKLCLTPLLY